MRRLVELTVVCLYVCCNLDTQDDLPANSGSADCFNSNNHSKYKGNFPVVRQPNGSTTHWFDSPLVRQPISPTAH